MNFQKAFIIYGILFLTAIQLHSQATQWRGVNQTGHYPSTGLMKSWPDGGPELVFKTEDIGKGYSSAVVSDNLIFITGKMDTMDYISAINMSGDIVWQIPYGRAWTRSYAETRSTPSIVGNKIYLTSGNGELACIDKNEGKVIWNVDVMKKFDGVSGSWGTAESPLVFEDKVFFTVAGAKTTMVAFNRNSGEMVWQTEQIDDQNAFVSPTMINHNNQDMVVGVTAKYIFGVNPETGGINWKFKYDETGSPDVKIGRKRNNTVTPIYRDGHVYVTSGYDHVGAKLKLNEAGTDVELIWTDDVLDVHHGGAVLVDDHIYGSNWLNNREGEWCSISWETGKPSYTTEWNTKGSIIYADGMLYIYEEQRGHVGLVKPNPEKFELVSSFQITEGVGPHWAHPTIYDGKLLIRHGDVLMVYDIKAG